jgi:hypothetical protein
MENRDYFLFYFNVNPHEKAGRGMQDAGSFSCEKQEQSS